MANGAFDYTNYASYSQDPEFQRLEAMFSGLFGSNFPQFSYEAFIGDSAYRQRIFGQIQDPDDLALVPARTQALNALTSFFERKIEGDAFEKAGGPIDVSGVFEGLAGDIRQRRETEIQAGRADVSRSREGALRAAQETIAGTGLGRSGVQAGVARAFATDKARAIDRVGERARVRETQALLEVERRIRELEYSEELRERGVNEQTIRDAIAFDRIVQQMTNEFAFQQALQEKSFWDYFVPILNAAGTFIGAM